MVRSEPMPYEQTCFNCGVLRLHDVNNVRMFVAGSINRAGLNLSDDEDQALIAQGMEIMSRLAQNYKARMDGHKQDGRFSGYAASFLPKKLGQAWHRMHPEHHEVTDARTGKRVWVYFREPASFEEVTSGQQGRPAAIRERCDEWSPADAFGDLSEVA